VITLTIILAIVGSTGTVINLRANFYPIPEADKMNIYKYKVKVTPEIEPNSPVFKAVLDGCHEALGSFVLRDGKVFSSKLLFGNVINPLIIEGKNN
jgi:hypothetical protein